MPRLEKPASTATVPAASDQIERLIEAVNRVADHLQVLHNVMDDIRADFQWAVRNDAFHSPSPVGVPFTSMPVEPLASDFGDRLNRCTPENLPMTDEEPELTSSPARPPSRTSLFSEDGNGA